MSRHSPSRSRGSPDSYIFNVSPASFLSRAGQGSWWLLVQLQVFQRLFCVKGTSPSEYYFSLFKALNSQSKLSDGISWEGFTEGECRHPLFVLQLYVLLVVLYAEQLLGPLALMPDSHRSRSWEESLVASRLISFPHTGLHLSSVCSDLFLYFSCTGNQCLQQFASPGSSATVLFRPFLTSFSQLTVKALVSEFLLVCCRLTTVSVLGRSLCSIWLLPGGMSHVQLQSSTSLLTFTHGSPSTLSL